MTDVPFARAISTDEFSTALQERLNRGGRILNDPDLTTVVARASLEVIGIAIVPVADHADTALIERAEDPMGDPRLAVTQHGVSYSVAPVP